MGETLNATFRRRDDGSFEIQVRESWSGRSVSGSFVPPYRGKQLHALHKKLNTLESSDQELREIGLRLFRALCGSEPTDPLRRETPEQSSVQAVLRSVILRTLKRRGTVAITLCFEPGCEDLVRHPWELLHNGDHFLLASGIFTITRALLRPDAPVGCELPVHLPMRVLHIGSSPTDCVQLETEQSFLALQQGLARLIDTGQVLLERLEPPTFDELVRYLNSYGGVGVLDDNETQIPCYVVHFDGHGAYGRLCPVEHCQTVNESDARKCRECGRSLSRVKPQTYLCFCNDDGTNRFIDTQSLRELLLSGDVRLAVFSACETACVSADDSSHQMQNQPAIDATLATALVMAQVPAVVAMPFSLQDNLSPTFMYHFYEALADGRTLEEGLARARQALLPTQQKSWFIPVLYRHVAEGQEGPVPLLMSQDALEEHDHPLAHLNPPSTFVGREQELHDVEKLLITALSDQVVETKPQNGTRSSRTPRVPVHHIALIGPVGIGKSALAFEIAARHRARFPGGVIGVSLQGGKVFGDALLELLHALHIPVKNTQATDTPHRARLVLNTLRSLASRELPCLLVLDSFEEVKDRSEMEIWLHFLCSLPPEIVVLVTSRSNPETMMVAGGGQQCRWYDYRVGKMHDEDLLNLFTELAAASGLDQRIHLDDPRQQTILREICKLLDGYPLGAELLFGTARSIDGRVYTPEAATRSLEEVRDELRNTPLAGILAVLEVAFRHLSAPARLLLAYLAAFHLPFSREQIIMLVSPETLGAAGETVPVESVQHGISISSEVAPSQLSSNWRQARDELVQASFIQFDGRVYTIHPQVRLFALAHLPLEERHRVHRVVAAYYYTMPQPSAEEWFAAFEHLVQAGELEDTHEAVIVAVRASHALRGRGHARELLAVLRRAALMATRLGNRTDEGQVQCCLGSILRQLGKYSEAESCLRISVEFHRSQYEREEAGWALYELAMLMREEGNFQQAASYAQEGLALFREMGSVSGETWMQLVIGEISRSYGSYYEALGHFELALTAFRSLHDQEGVASTLRARGTVYEALGQYSRALNDYEEAQRLLNELGLRSMLAWVLADRSVVSADMGRLDVAEKLAQEALAICREQGARRCEAWTLRALGDIARERHQNIDARVYYEESLEIFGVLGDRVDQARVHSGLGAIACEEGEYLDAREQFEQAQTIASEQGAKQIYGRALRGLGDIMRLLQQLEEADRYYREAASIAIELDTPAEYSAVLRRQGLLHRSLGRYREALECWTHALALDQRLGHPARAVLQHELQALLVEEHLEDAYDEFSKRYSVAHS